MKILLFSPILFIFPALSFAFFCPTNFNQIEYGMTPDQVIKQCGKADTEKESKRTSENIPQEWTYFVAQPLATGPTNAFQTVGTLKTTINFDGRGNAINITVNGIAVGATSICTKPIQLGSTRDTVKRACGGPNFITKQAPPGDDTIDADIPITEFTYNTNPPTILVFENGVLAEKR